MGTSRMYADENGDTTWQAIDLAEHENWRKGFDAKDIKFGVREPNIPQDWHAAPARQFVIVLSGQLEITYVDGTKRVFGAGEARLMDNITGKGHSTMALGDEPCITATVVLTDQEPRIGAI
jgi:hydroxyethylthiazole kinase-like sugar kinase family protein